ncbi:FAD-dependent monooxygenase [Streptomyces sp. NPDC002623]
MLADVRLTEEPPRSITANGTGDCFALQAPFGDGWYRVFAGDRRHQVPDSTPLAPEEVAAVARNALGSDFGTHDPRWMSRFHCDERQVPHYRIGRVFLAGDAAHCHSPAGGQGMNTGLQDAANLGWKLAAVLRGAPEELLDAYHTERHPVGRQVVRSSGALVRMATLKSAPARVLRGLIGGIALRIPAIARKTSGQISGIGVGYGTTTRRAPDTQLADGRRLYEALRGGKFVLIGPTDITGWEDRIQAVPGPSPMLVRPDGYIAWDGTEPLNLTDWCGAPNTGPHQTV